MEVILLERVAKLGQMGDVVKVKDGFARNYLLPRKKARRATQANKQLFESERVQLETQNLELKKDAEAVLTKLDGQSFVVLRQAGESGQLYGSVSPRDVADALTAGGFTVNRSQADLMTPIKSLGLHKVAIVLHPEVSATVTINVARTQDEADRQSRGEDVIAQARADQEIDIAALFEVEPESAEDEAATEEER